jgi:chemotaxis methyl-accepting protein methylase
MITTTKGFPPNWYFKSWDTTKTHAYYMVILEIMSSVKFKHFNLKQHHTEPAYSIGIIKNVLHLTD